MKRPYSDWKYLQFILTLKNTDSDAFHEVGARPTDEHTCVAEVTVVNQKLAFELLFIGLSFSCDIDSIAPTTAARDYFDAIKKPINILRCAVLSPYKTGQVNRFIEVHYVSTFKCQTC